MKVFLIGGLLAVLAAASAQRPDPKRIDAIWSAAGDRLSRQTDAWFKLGDYPRTVQILKFHFEMNPKDAEVGTNLGFMLENIEEYDQALAVYIHLRTANPNDPDDAFPEAFFYFRKKAFAKVPPLLEPTIKKQDPHANNYRTLANSYEKMSMFGDSKRVLELYLSRHPDDLAAKAHLERIEKKLKGGVAKKS